MKKNFRQSVRFVHTATIKSLLISPLANKESSTWKQASNKLRVSMSWDKKLCAIPLKSICRIVPPYSLTSITLKILFNIGNMFADSTASEGSSNIILSLLGLYTFRFMELLFHIVLYLAGKADKRPLIASSCLSVH